MMKVHTAIAKALADLGVDTVFGLLGEGNLFIVQSLVENHDCTYVAASHEGAATSMAAGYALMSGRIGAATVTHGPGLTNAVTALTEAARNDVPMLLICGDTAPDDRQNLQDIDHAAIIAPTGAGFEAIRSPLTAAHDVAAAVRRAQVEHRPIIINVPVHFQWQDTPERVVVTRAAPHAAAHPTPDALDQAVGIIASARRPIVLVGRGAAGEESSRCIAALAERIGAPLATTLRAKDLFRGHPFSLGVFGTDSIPIAVETIGQADCIIAFGAGLNEHTASQGSFLSGKQVVQCDIDPRRLGRWYAIDAGIVGDAAAVAQKIIEWLDDAEVVPSGFRTDHLARQLLEQHARTPPTVKSRNGTVDIRTFLSALDRVLPVNRTLVFDMGRYRRVAMHYLHVQHPRYLVPSGMAFGVVGLGMSAAIGVGVASRNRTTIAIAGDGGFMMGGINEFNTAVRYNLDLIALILNDGSYGAEYRQLETRDMSPAISLFRWPDFAPIADSLGGTGVTVRSLDELELIHAALQARRGPLLIDVKLDPATIPSAID